MAASGARPADPGTSATAPVDEDTIAVAFERVPRLVDALGAAGPYARIDDVLQQAARLIGELGEETQVALLNAHPRIGAARAGLSGASASEQSGADAATLAELASLNDEYELRFGFRCVAFVAGRPIGALVPVLRERLGHDRETELQTGLREFLAIARDRLTHDRSHRAPDLAR